MPIIILQVGRYCGDPFLKLSRKDIPMDPETLITQALALVGGASSSHINGQPDDAKRLLCQAFELLNDHCEMFDFDLESGPQATPPADSPAEES